MKFTCTICGKDLGWIHDLHSLVTRRVCERCQEKQDEQEEE